MAWLFGKSKNATPAEEENPFTENTLEAIQQAEKAKENFAKISNTAERSAGTRSSILEARGEATADLQSFFTEVKNNISSIISNVDKDARRFGRFDPLSQKEIVLVKKTSGKADYFSESAQYRTLKAGLEAHGFTVECIESTVPPSYTLKISWANPGEKREVPEDAKKNGYPEHITAEGLAASLEKARTTIENNQNKDQLEPSLKINLDEQAQIDKEKTEEAKAAKREEFITAKKLAHARKFLAFVAKGFSLYVKNIYYEAMRPIDAGPNATNYKLDFNKVAPLVRYMSVDMGDLIEQIQALPEYAALTKLVQDSGFEGFVLSSLTLRDGRKALVFRIEGFSENSGV